jgi:hypothetical protein
MPYHEDDLYALDIGPVNPRPARTHISAILAAPPPDRSTQHPLPERKAHAPTARVLCWCWCGARTLEVPLEVIRRCETLDCCLGCRGTYEFNRRRSA